MSEFVNYNKRSVALPKGCKDLADLLVPERKSNQGGIYNGPKPKVVKHQGEGGLADVEKYVRVAFSSAADFIMLAIYSSLLSVTVSRWREHSGRDMASLNFLHTAERERQIRELFARYRLDDPPRFEAEDIKPMPRRIPNAPIYGLFDIQPFPTRPDQACRILQDIFRASAGIDDVPIRYSLLEYNNPPA